jgi:hypothetical protein
VFHEDIAHSLSADLLDAQFSQLTDDPSQPEASNFSDLEDQFAQFLRRALAALGILGFGLPSFSARNQR